MKPTHIEYKEVQLFTNIKDNPTERKVTDCEFFYDKEKQMVILKLYVEEYPLT